MNIFLRGSEDREMSFRERERQTDMGFLVKLWVLAPISSEAWPSWAAGDIFAAFKINFFCLKLVLVILQHK